MHFTRRRGGDVEADVAPGEVGVLARAVGELLELLSGDAEPPADPLEALVGLSPGATRPDDPALQRLLPDAYRDDAFEQPEAAAAASLDFRRYTEADLRAGKRAHADVVLETLADVAGGGRLRLDRDQADAWLGTLNDLRLVLGVRLGVTEDTLDEEQDDEDDGRVWLLRVFSWLGWLQESLLECLEPRAPH